MADTDDLNAITAAGIVGDRELPDLEFSVLVFNLLSYVVKKAPPRQASIFADACMGVRKELLAKDLAHKASVFLAINPNPTDAQLRELAHLPPEAVPAFLAEMTDEDRSRFATVLEFRGPRPAPEIKIEGPTGPMEIHLPKPDPEVG